MFRTLSYRDLFTESELLRLCPDRRKKENDPFPISLRILYNDQYRWLLTEVDKNGIAFGLCDFGMGFPELGYVDLNEIIKVVGNLLYVDREFVAIAPLSVYADAALQSGKIIYDFPPDLQQGNYV